MIVRRAAALDARHMAALLNEIIAKGGTTAKTDPVTADEIAQKMNAPQAIWHLAEDESGNLKGFQYFAPHPDLPANTVDIATFVKLGETGLGIGSRLFDATKTAARAHGYAYINAVIRADNSGGLAYYQSRGFEHIKMLRNQTLADGTIVDKVVKRFEL